MALTKVTGGILSQPIDLGITTATTGFFSGIVTAQSVRVLGDLTVDGSTTTLDTVVTEVDRLEVGANNVTVGVAITQSGTGDILKLYDSSTPVFAVKDGGKVGIGTDNPLQKLHVTDGTSANIYIETKKSDTGSTAGLYYKTSSSAASDFFKTGIVLEDDGTSHARGKLHILQNNTADGSNATLSDSVVTFAQDGKVGIGTNNPGYKVESYGSDASVIVHYAGHSRGGIAAFENQKIALLTTFVNDDLVFGYSNSPLSTANFVERMRIDNGTATVTIKNYTTDNAQAPYLLFHNRGNDTTDNSNVYNMGGIAAAGYRDVANPSIVAAIQFERQITASGASSGGNIVFRTGFNGTTSHTGISKTLELTYEGHLLPGANNQYDLGSTAKGWRNVYMNDLNLSNMNGDTNDVDGTQGSWTIQEGKDHLDIINRLNGKKFKIKMEEIS